MPKFLVTPVGGTAPAAALPFQSAQTNDGSAQVGQALQNFGNTISQIANKAILAEQSQVVTNANTITQLDLASLGTASDLKQMGIAEATTEYRKRSRDIYNNATKDMSPGQRRLFEKSWGPNSSSAFVKFQAAAVKRTTEKLEAKMITNEDDVIRLAKINGFKMEALAGVTASHQNAVTNGVYSADQAAKRTVAFTRRFAKSALTHHINVSAQSQNEEEVKQTYIDFLEGGKDLPEELKFWWGRLDPEDHDALTSDALSRLTQLQSMQKRTTDAEEKQRKQAQSANFGRIKITIDAGKAGDENAAMEMWEFTPQYFLDEIKTGGLTGEQAATLQTLMTKPDQLKTHVPSFSQLITDTYNVAELPETEQEAAFDVLIQRAGALVTEEKLTGGDYSKFEGLVDKLKQREIKTGPIAQERKRLRRELGIQEGLAIINRFEGFPQRARAEAALTEFDREMLDDESPYRNDPTKFVDSLISRVLREVVPLDRLITPRYMTGLEPNIEKWKAEDVTKAKALLMDQRQMGQVRDRVFTEQTILLNKISRAVTANRRETPSGQPGPALQGREQ